MSLCGRAAALGARGHTASACLQPGERNWAKGKEKEGRENVKSWS